MLDRGWRSIVIAASGPSMDADQAAIAIAARDASRCRVIAVNDTWALLPTADAIYACDLSWFRAPVNEVVAQRADVPRDTTNVAALRVRFAGEVWTQSEEAAKEHGLRHVRGEKGVGIHASPDTIRHGGNSGYQAIGLAVLFGARRIVLVGYDMQRGPDGKGPAHFFGNHPAPLSQGNPTGWVKHFTPLAADLTARNIEVINCSKATALTQFPRLPLEDALSMEAA